MRRYRDKSDRNLLDCIDGQLTDLGREAALAEAARRGPHLEALMTLHRNGPMEVAHGHGPLTECARYLNPLDAPVLAACLQNEGLVGVEGG